MNEQHPDELTRGIDLRAHRIIAGVVFLFSLILYFSTIAPTVSFWDCGEFIACSYSMGVPHPPGSPFFLLLGRIFTLFNPVADIGLKVNSLSAIVSALTVMLTYLVIVRLVRQWRGPEHSLKEKVVMYGAGVIGAVAFGASHSFWFNGVEAEVYAISMFFTALVVWLAVRWMDESERDYATKYLLLIAYFVGLATGIHLLNVLALSPIVLIIYFKKYKFTWKGFVLAVAVSFAAVLAVYPGIVDGIPKLLDAGIGYLIIFLLVLIAVFIWALRNRRTVWATVLASALLVILGYSTYTEIYVRSNVNPVINENQPDTVDRLISYLNREQYGAVGPVEMQDVNQGTMARLRRSGAKFIPIGAGKILRFHILERKAPFWDYQINQMYIRYLSWQYFIGELGQPLIVPFLLGLLGMIWHFWRDPKRGFVVLMLFLITGLAIVFYLNQENPQPRERDYAYVGSFFAFALWIGMGAVAFVEFVEDLLRKRGEKLRRIAAYGTVAVLAAAVPVNMLVQNYHSHNRSGNYVAWDYSRNMLETCAPNGMIFTNGDNDTFPLWYLQVVEGVRRDVRIINLSLLNTNWYIKQLRDEYPKVPIAFSDKDIDERLTGHTDEALLLRYWPKGNRDWTISTPDSGKMQWKVPATMYIPTGMPNEKANEPNFLRVQDIMILHIIEQNHWKKPIYFAVTVSQSNLLGLSPYLTMEGLAFRLYPHKVDEVNEPVLRKNMFETYAGHYRNLNNPKVYYFDNIIKLLQNYRSGFLQLVYEYYRDRQKSGPEKPSGIPEEQWGQRFEELTPSEKALYTLHRMDAVITPDAIPLTSREVALQVGRLFFEFGDSTGGVKYFDSALDLSRGNPDGQLQVAFFFAEHGKDLARAEQIIDNVLDNNPSAQSLFNAAAIYDRAKQPNKVLEVLDKLNERKDLDLRDQLDLAAYYFSKKKTEKAESIYQRLAKDNPRNGEVFGGLLEVYRARHDTANVVKLLTDWIAKNPKDRQASDLLKQWSKAPSKP